MSRQTSKHFDYTVEESVKKIANELERDLVGLWQIIPVLIESFGIDGRQLEEYTQRHIQALLANGAIPVKYDPKKQGWVEVYRYTDIRKRVDAIVADWLPKSKQIHFDSLWFGLPEMIKEEIVR
ncbi:hypothetical protein DZA50_06495 [Kangiella sp. HD9-110m-PIT-SAG07]|nr:hypothetical protein DZA50_06495 [Kangiella sp. HD9-110m-PIT-SAG07]